MTEASWKTKIDPCRKKNPSVSAYIFSTYTLLKVKNLFKKTPEKQAKNNLISQHSRQSVLIFCFQKIYFVFFPKYKISIPTTAKRFNPLADSKKHPKSLVFSKKLFWQQKENFLIVDVKRFPLQLLWQDLNMKQYLLKKGKLN